LNQNSVSTSCSWAGLCSARASRAVAACWTSGRTRSRLAGGLDGFAVAAQQLGLAERQHFQARQPRAQALRFGQAARLQLFGEEALQPTLGALLGDGGGVRRARAIAQAVQGVQGALIGAQRRGG
jgi:hypothetical protein